jgi:hypothetical protein
MERPEQVRQVLDTLRKQGITQTFRAVMKRLEAFSPLGFSCAGVVMDPRWMSRDSGKATLSPAAGSAPAMRKCVAFRQPVCAP